MDANSDVAVHHPTLPGTPPVQEGSFFSLAYRASQPPLPPWPFPLPFHAGKETSNRVGPLGRVSSVPFSFFVRAWTSRMPSEGLRAMS